MAILKEALDLVTTPSNMFLLLVCFALVALILRWRRSAVTCLTLGLTGFLAFGLTSLSEILISPLVTRFPPIDLTDVDPPFGLIVLGAGLSEAHANHYGALMDLEDGGEAIPTTALLAKRFPDARIILSGGSGTDIPPAPLRGTDGMRRLLLEFGISDDRITIDPYAATTAQRVRNTFTMVGDDHDQDWWVITPAHRMPRVMGAYRKIGFDPTPYPIDFKWIPPFNPSYFYTLTDGLRLTDMGAKEWRGLLFYYLTDKSDTLYPGPSP